MVEQSRKGRVLVIGGTGVMGSYIVPELLSLGFRVDSVSIDDAVSNHPDLRTIRADCFNLRVLRELLKCRYDAIIDYMTYQTYQFAERFELLLNSTDHLVFLSSYRVYSELQLPTREDSPRLLDVVDDQEFLTTDDYSLFKCREENILRSSRYDNWTIVRPAITYSNRRFQLITLEAPQILRCAREGRTVYLPREALGVQATMTWSGDVAKMIGRLVLNPAARREAYTVSTAEHHSWAEVAGYYGELVGLKYEAIDTQDYLDFFGNTLTAKFQLKYDRCQNRIMDNGKVLAATGLTQSDFVGLKDGLEMELKKLPADVRWPDTPVYAAMRSYEERLRGARGNS